jgi:hypothetical protein
MSTPAENGTKEDAPTRRRVSFAPLDVPPESPHVKLPPGKRRWSLIRSLAKGKRLTSLTNEEDKFMKKISSGGSSHSELNRATSVDSEESCKARDDLRKSMFVHKDQLTQAEKDFLEDLIDTPDVEPERIEKVQQVLCNDPLYHCEENKVEAEPAATEDDKEQSQQRRTSLLQYPSYRKELWLQLRTESQEVSAETFAFVGNSVGQEQNPEEVKEEEEHFKPEQKRKSSKWGFIYQFQKALHLIDDGDKDDDTAELDDDELDDDLSTTFRVLAPSIEDLIETPTVLTPPIMDGLRAFLPFAVQHDNFWLKYSLAGGDGASFYTLLHKVRNSARTFIAIETDQGEVFGSFTSSPWRVHPDKYYGSAEAFLWRLKKSRFTRCASVEEQVQLESDVEVFEWSRENRNIQSWTGMKGEIIVGAGGYEDDPEKDAKEFGSGLSISADLTRGFSEKCLTFNSPPLATRSNDGVFNIANIEVWTLTPVLSVEEAERLELSRQFVFDHGGFCQ